MSFGRPRGSWRSSGSRGARPGLGSGGVSGSPRSGSGGSSGSGVVLSLGLLPGVSSGVSSKGASASKEENRKGSPVVGSISF